MSIAAEIGSTIVIKGDVTANENLVISGRVEGSIRVTGHALTITEGADVLAEVHARAVVVAGRVFGKIVADERLELRATADVEGELSTPVLVVAEGAMFDGKAETTGASKAGLKLAS
jgi:cytoskeletal protein CcmA (bactofilin family)